MACDDEGSIELKVRAILLAEGPRLSPVENPARDRFPSIP